MSDTPLPDYFSDMAIEEHEAEIERLQYERAELRAKLLGELEGLEVVPFLEDCGVPAEVLVLLESYLNGDATFGEMREETLRNITAAAEMHQRAIEQSAA